MFTRRIFLVSTVGAAVAATPIAQASASNPTPIVVTSWDFAAGANNVAWPILDKGGSAIDAVEAGINYVELLANEFYVGYGGSPNTQGETTLDAMIMWGPSHDVGAVGCLKRVKKAVSVARQILENTQHTLLVGDDATRFAVKMGFNETSLTNAASLKAWEEWSSKGEKSDAWQPERRGSGKKPEGHDTVGSMAIDQQGNICVGCSTNGRSFKLPGRVGDSPIAGAGAYCDNDVGAAIATGDGDVMMRFLPTYHTVELMRKGASPEDAAYQAMRRIISKGYNFDGAIVALNKHGQHGSVRLGWEGEDFGYGVQSASESKQFNVGSM